MKSRIREFVDRAIDAMAAAIATYNSPNFPYRAEAFTILALNAWELILKAKWLKEHNNRLSSLYVPDGKRFHYKRTSSGTPFTQSVEFLRVKLEEKKILDKKASKNLKGLIEIRDTAAHFYHRNKNLTLLVSEIGMACLKNFVAAVKDWFNQDLSRLNLFPIPIAFDIPEFVVSTRSSREEENLLTYLNQLRAGDDDPESPYSVAVNVELGFIKSKSSDAMLVRITNDPTALAVQLTEEEIRKKYVWRYVELTQKCKERYRNFKVDKNYHSIRRELEGNKKYALERRLDPEKPKPRKIFYSSSILEEFDKRYKLKKRN